MANNNKNKTGQNVGNQQNTTQTGGANNGVKKRRYWQNFQ